MLVIEKRTVPTKRKPQLKTAKTKIAPALDVEALREEGVGMNTERYYVVFASSFRYESAPCISHETIDKRRTLCGRQVTDAVTLEPDNNNLEPDCKLCCKALARLRQAPLMPDASDASDEAQLKCEACIQGHIPGSLRKPCNALGCECWCNRSLHTRAQESR